MRAAFVHGKGQRIDGSLARRRPFGRDKPRGLLPYVVQTDFTKTILIVDGGGVVDRI